MGKKRDFTNQKFGAIIFCGSCRKEIWLSSRHVVTKGLICKKCGSKETMLKLK
jgi:DNA-directed RNA polymerase subunit RPC12/RpoP